jgi:hypothetical protein
MQTGKMFRVIPDAITPVNPGAEMYKDNSFKLFRELVHAQ